MDKAKRLRELFDGPGIIRLAGAHNALGARLAERAGFDGVWSSGLEISTSCAVPDANILTMSEYLAAAQSMADAVDIPIMAVPQKSPCEPICSCSPGIAKPRHL